MKLAIYQPDIVWEEPEANFRKLERVLDAADLHGVQLLCLPELFSIGFTMNPSLAETESGKTVTFLRSLAKKHKLFVVGTFLEKGNPRPRNTVLLINAHGEVIHKYAKVHLFSLDKEHECFEPGSDPGMFSLDGVNAGFVICYDLRFPELFRLMMTDKKRRPSIFIVPANWPAVRITHWKTLLQARAIENQAFVIGINRVGESPLAKYCGNSIVIDPLGAVILDAQDKEGLHVVDIDLSMAEAIRSKFPFLDDRKTDWYKKNM